MIIQHNMAAVNTMMQLGITNANLRKSSEKLSSGYSVNRAADNAAALSISEKKRSQIRGLIRATRNAEDGVSFVKTGDGAMSQMEALLQRMRELSIQSLNIGANEEEDRKALQMEMDQLQCEIDRINDETEFNKKPVFEHYPDTYSIFYGNRVWSQDQIHTITPDNQSLVVKYVKEEGGSEEEVTLTIPEGEYSTQELIDEMDDVVTALGEDAAGLYLEYSSEHTCNVVLRDGVEIKDVSGGLSYLLFRQSGGSKVGSLIGTTLLKPNFPLQVKTGENDELSFTVEYFDGRSVPVSITVPEGSYMRSDIIRFLNEELLKKAPGITASEYGDYCVQVGGEDGFITGLKGNMFRIDDKDAGEEVFVSVFYDNTKYGEVRHLEGEFTGGAIINPYDISNNTFMITEGNNTLSIRVNGGDGDPYEQIVLDPGSYKVDDMVAQLQQKFNEKGIPVTVEKYGSRQPSVNQPDVNYEFEGIRIKTLSVGKGSKIEFDVPNSSAYSRLFENKLYTDIGRDSTIKTSGYFYYTPPSLTGGKGFGADSFPLMLDDKNSSFKITLKEGDGAAGDEYTINMAQKKYSSLNDIIQEINTQIKAGGIGLQKIQAGSYDGKIRLTPVSGSDTVTEIDVKPATGSNGYETLFVGKSVTYNKQNPAIFDIKPDADGKINFNDTNNKMTVALDSGEERQVAIPPGEYDSDSLAEEITKQLSRETTYTPIPYYGSVTGGETGQIRPSNGSVGSANHQGTGFQEGTGGTGNGSTEIKDGKPAKCWVKASMPASVQITGDNAEFKVQIDNTVYTVSLAEKIGQSVSRGDLIHLLNTGLNNQIQSDASKVTVSLNGSGQLQVEANYPGQRKITMPQSGFLDSVDQSPVPAKVWTTPLAEQTVFNSTVTLNVEVNGVTTGVPLGPGSYSRQQIADAISNSLPGVSASVNGDYVVIQTNATGNGANLKIDPASSAYAPLLNTPATSTGYISEPVVIRNNDHRPGKFTVTVNNGSPITVAIPDSPEGGYTREQIAKNLDDLLKSSGVRVSLTSSGRLNFRTDATGDGTRLKVEGTLGATAYTPPEIKAEPQPDGSIQLIPTKNNNYSVTPGGKESLLQPTGGITSTSAPEQELGHIQGQKFQMVTRNPFPIPNPVQIKSYSKDLHFKYRVPGRTQDIQIDIEMEEGSYDHDQLKGALQAKLDAAMAAAGVSGVDVDITPEGKMTLTGKKQGEYLIRRNTSSSPQNMTGGFYEYVMKGSMLIGSKEDPMALDGRQVTDDIYIVGRKDIRNQTSVIEPEVNDDLSIDVTVNGTVHTLKIMLDPGSYSGDALVSMLQGKLDEALEAAQIPNLPVGAVKAGIGVYDPKVEGSDDSNSLFFYLNPETDLDEGDYRIDGLGGKSLFTIFYKTEGDLMPAYLSGTRDISGGVEIIPGVNDSFTIDVDGVSFPYTIVPSGEYSTADLIKLLNEKILKSPNAHLKAKMSGNSLKLEYEKMGEHTIANIQGPAKMTLFYEVDGRVGDGTDLWLQIGANAGQGMTLERFSMSTLSMGINSIVITQKKYADKALQRLDDALNYLNSSRSVYGAKQNRLEYAGKANTNTAENLQASESRDRDANMAKEMVEFAKSRIMEQAGTALLAQMFQQPQSVLALLR